MLAQDIWLSSENCEESFMEFLETEKYALQRLLRRYVGARPMCVSFIECNLIPHSVKLFHRLFLFT